MKRIFSILAACAVLVVLLGCNGDTPEDSPFELPQWPAEISFGQMRDTQTGQVFTFGDSLEDINAIFYYLNGFRPFRQEFPGHVRYAYPVYSGSESGAVIAFYNGRAYKFEVHYTVPRYALGVTSAASFDMLTDDFSDWHRRIVGWALRCFDAYGNPVVGDFRTYELYDPPGSVYQVDVFGERGEMIYAIHVTCMDLLREMRS